MKLFVFFLLFLSETVFAQSDDLSTIARKSLLKNIHKVNDVYFLSAGDHQFKSFWTRDFAFSAKGLLLLKQEKVVKDHLNYLLAHQREDHLVPLYVDSISPMLRVGNETMNRALGIDHDLAINNNIKSYYFVNGKYPAIDSNLLTLIAAKEYFDFTQDKEWFFAHEKDFKNIFHYYDSLLDDGLIVQAEHSDWQDSASRKGKTFFTNLLYYQVARDFQLLSVAELLQLKEKIIQTFYDESTGLYKSIQNEKYVSLDGILWTIDHKLLGNEKELYSNLKKHELFTEFNLPGFTTYPSYDSKELYLQVKVVGLREYHGNLFWSWLMAYSGKIAKEMGDNELYETIEQTLQAMAQRDGIIHEIYMNDKEHAPFKTRLYFSEGPFSWGASSIIEMLKQQQ